MLTTMTESSGRESHSGSDGSGRESRPEADESARELQAGDSRQGRRTGGTTTAAVAEIARPLNGFIAAVAVLAGAFVSRYPTRWVEASLGAAAAFAAAAGANALNDAMDAREDALNRPDRPIPSGKIRPRSAVAAAVVAYLVSVGLASLVGVGPFVLAVTWVAATVAYSVGLKGTPVLGNAVAAAVAATPFLMGGLTQDKYLLAMIPTLLAFLAHLAREAVKDAEDVQGDIAAGVGTLAVRKGAAASVALARATMLMLIGFAALPFAFRIYGWGYAAVVCVIDVILVWGLVLLGGSPTADRLGQVSRMLKSVMVLGLLAFVLGVL